MAKKSSSGGAVLVGIIVAIGYGLASLGREVWTVLGLLFAGWVFYKIFLSPKSTPAGANTAPSPTTNSVRPQRIAVNVTPGFGTAKRGNPEDGDAYWVNPSAPVQLAGKSLGALVYFGAGLQSVDGTGPEPALINPGVEIASGITDCTVRRLDYWSSYSRATPQARAAYLYWLTTGRKDPKADIGYVFLYFYGLERRVLYDARGSTKAKDAIPAIEGEIERLLGLYSSNASFRRYAGALLDLLRTRFASSKRYLEPPVPLGSGQPLLFSHRLGLAQCAADGVPLPGNWAYAWLTAEPTTNLRTAAKRCPEEFRQLFLIAYREQYGEGLPLPRNRTRLKFQYTPASVTFGYRAREIDKELDLPDVTVLSGPIKKLQQIAETCYTTLDSYSRLMGKNPGLSGTLDAMVELPFALWPESYQRPVKQVQALVQRADKPIALPLAKVLSWMPEGQVVSRQKYQALCRLFAQAGLGVEPDLRFGGSLPEQDSTIVLFAQATGTIATRPSSVYAAASLTLDMAVAVAASDGHVADEEKQFLLTRLNDWLHLSESDRRRLHARLRLLLMHPPKLTALNGRIEPLERPAREAIADFLALVAAADGVISPEEVKALERSFKLLGLDVASVYTKLHGAAMPASTEALRAPPASEPVTIKAADGNVGGYALPTPPKKQAKNALALDPAKVAALKADSERVSAMLSAIFTEPEEATAPSDSHHEVPSEHVDDTLMGLDPEHTAFARLLLTRAQWTRTELGELAQDRELLLDGALERINDAAFDKFGKAFSEGEDPVEINQDVAHEVMDEQPEAA